VYYGSTTCIKKGIQSCRFFWWSEGFGMSWKNCVLRLINILLSPISMDDRFTGWIDRQYINVQRGSGTLFLLELSLIFMKKDMNGCVILLRQKPLARLIKIRG